MVLEAGKGLENSEPNARICNKVRALFLCSSLPAMTGRFLLRIILFETKQSAEKNLYKI